MSIDGIFERRDTSEKNSDEKKQYLDPKLLGLFESTKP